MKKSYRDAGTEVAFAMKHVFRSNTISQHLTANNKTKPQFQMINGTHSFLSQSEMKSIVSVIEE